MKVTIYTINDCQFSQAEKDYLKKNNIAFEEKNLETNRDFLTEMLALANNFAGTPVTEIVKDTGEKLILKGFTPDEFDKALGIQKAPEPVLQTSVPNVAPTVTAVPATSTPSTTTQPQPDTFKIESLSDPIVDSQPVSMSMSGSGSDMSTSPSMTPPPSLVEQTPITQAPMVEQTPSTMSQPIGAMNVPPSDSGVPAETPLKPDPALDSVLQTLQNQVQATAPKI